MDNDIISSIDKTNSSILELQDNYYAWEDVISSYQKLIEHAPDQKEPIKLTGLTSEKNAEKLATAWIQADNEIRELETTYHNFATDIKCLLDEQDSEKIKGQEYVLTKIEQDYGFRPVKSQLENVENAITTLSQTFEDLESRTEVLSRLVEERYGLKTPKSIRYQEDPTYINESVFETEDLQFQPANKLNTSISN